MKALIVDDEPIARQVLREQLEELAGMYVVGEAANGLEAVELISQLDPEVVFLDLQMPEMDGFQVARNLRAGRPPVVVYVTAFHQHALQAFEAGAVDYLLKPVRKERLEAALQKARAHLAGMAPKAETRQSDLKKIVGRAGRDYHLLDPSDVVAFIAEGELVYVVTAQARYYCDHSLRALEDRLPAIRFRRVHRQTIINTDHIRRISPLSSKRYLLKMSNGMEVVVSKRLAGVIREETHW